MHNKAIEQYDLLRSGVLEEFSIVCSALLLASFRLLVGWRVYCPRSSAPADITHLTKLRALLQVSKRMILHRRRGTGWCEPVDGPDGSLRFHGLNVPRESFHHSRYIEVKFVVFVCLQNQLIDHLEQHGLGRQDLDFATWSGLLGASRQDFLIHFRSCFSYVPHDSCQMISVSGTVCRHVCKSSRRAHAPTSTELAAMSR